MPAIKFHDDHLLSDVIKIMYPGRLEQGGSDPVLNQRDMEASHNIPIQETNEEVSVPEDREGDNSEGEIESIKNTLRKSK